MKLLFTDTETNALDTERGFIQEIAWAIYDSGSKRLLKSVSHIIRWNIHYEVDPGALAVTNLSRDFCETQGRPAPQVFTDYLADLGECDALVGHNLIAFDEKIISSNIKRALGDAPREKFMLDTMYDLPITNPRQNMTLKYLALDHGYILSDAHQAMADVFACAAVFFKYDFQKVLEIARTPIVTVCGFTDFHDQAGREAFHKAKFRWNRDNRRWERKCRAFYVPGTQLELGYNLWTADGEMLEYPFEKEQQQQEKPFNGLPF